MRYNKEKIFWIARGTSKDVVYVSWDEKEEYYSFIKRNITSGYHQISITSEMMLKIIAALLDSSKWKIERIEMMEDDEDIISCLKNMIDETRVNPCRILKLFNYLGTIIEDSSIEVKRIYLSGRDENGNLQGMFVQVNGIIGIYNAENEVHNQMSMIIREYM